jgi:drug/metabolite transporter superfamily protein YnfA
MMLNLIDIGSSEAECAWARGEHHRGLSIAASNALWLVPALAASGFPKSPAYKLYCVIVWLAASLLLTAFIWPSLPNPFDCRGEAGAIVGGLMLCAGTLVLVGPPRSAG